jgi:hypothetical protein
MQENRVPKSIIKVLNIYARAQGNIRGAKSCITNAKCCMFLVQTAKKTVTCP